MWLSSIQLTFFLACMWVCACLYTCMCACEKEKYSYKTKTQLITTESRTINVFYYLKEHKSHKFVDVGLHYLYGSLIDLQAILLFIVSHLKE